MVGGGAESTLFSSGMAEFDENFDGIAESRSPVGDGKLGLFSPEKRNLAKLWPKTRNLSNIDKISGIFDKNVAFQKKFLLELVIPCLTHFSTYL